MKRSQKEVKKAKILEKITITKRDKKAKIIGRNDRYEKKKTHQSQPGKV
jgi:hypothetical protein